MTAADVSVREDVVYGRGGGRELRCDVYTAAGGEAPAPGLLLVHGGGWRQGEKGAMREFALRLARAGFVCVAPEYRLTPEAPWPAQIHDVKAALRWLRASSADLGVDPGRIAVQGSSAGGHLVLLAAGTPGAPEFEGEGGSAGVSTAVAAAVAIYPPVLFFTGERRPRGGTPARALMGDAATDADARAASPVNHVSAAFPPTVLLHGSADKTVPPSASVVMYEALVAAGAPVELHMYAREPHGFARSPAFIDLVTTTIAHFFHRHLAHLHVRVRGRRLAPRGAIGPRRR